MLHFELIEKYHVSLKKLMQQGISNPEFYGDPYRKPFKNLLLRNQWTAFYESLYVALGTRAHHNLLGLTLTYFMTNFVTYAFIGKSETVDFSETIAACDLKIGRCRQLIELIKVCEYSRSRSFLDLGQRSLTFENLKLLFSETTEPFLTKFCMQV